MVSTLDINSTNLIVCSSIPGPLLMCIVDISSKPVLIISLNIHVLQNNSFKTYLYASRQYSVLVSMNRMAPPD